MSIDDNVSLIDLIGNSAKHFASRTPTPGQTLAQLHTAQGNFSSDDAPGILISYVKNDISVISEIIAIYEEEMTNITSVEIRQSWIRSFSILLSGVIGTQITSSITNDGFLSSVIYDACPFDRDLNQEILDFLFSYLGDVPLARYVLEGVYNLVKCNINSDVDTCLFTSDPNVLNETSIAQNLQNIPAFALLNEITSKFTVNTLPQASRKSYFELVWMLFEKYPEQFLASGRRFLVQFIIDSDGEKDPRNLLVVFNIWHKYLKSVHPAVLYPHIVEVFENISCYFPITFTSIRHDGLTVTGTQLQHALVRALGANPALSPYVLPFLMEKGTVDSLTALADCIYGWGGNVLVDLAYEDAIERIINRYTLINEDGTEVLSETANNDSEQSTGCGGGSCKSSNEEESTHSHSHSKPASGCCGGSSKSESKAKSGGCCGGSGESKKYTTSVSSSQYTDIRPLLRLAHTTVTPSLPSLFTHIINRPFDENERPEPSHLSDMWSDIRRTAVAAAEQVLTDACISVSRAIISVLCPSSIVHLYSTQEYPPKITQSAPFVHFKPVTGAGSFVGPMMETCVKELMVPDSKQSKAHLEIITKSISSSFTAATCIAPEFYKLVYERFNANIPYSSKVALLSTIEKLTESIVSACNTVDSHQLYSLSSPSTTDIDSEASWEYPSSPDDWMNIRKELLTHLSGTEEDDSSPSSQVAVPLSIDCMTHLTLHPLQHVLVSIASLVRRLITKHVTLMTNYYNVHEDNSAEVEDNDCGAIGNGVVLHDIVQNLISTIGHLMSAKDNVRFDPYPSDSSSHPILSVTCTVADVPATSTSYHTITLQKYSPLPLALTDKLLSSVLSLYLTVKLPFTYSFLKNAQNPKISPLSIRIPITIINTAKQALLHVPQAFSDNFTDFVVATLKNTVSSLLHRDSVQSCSSLDVQHCFVLISQICGLVGNLPNIGISHVLIVNTCIQDIISDGVGDDPVEHKTLTFLFTALTNILTKLTHSPSHSSVNLNFNNDIGCALLKNIQSTIDFLVSLQNPPNNDEHALIISSTAGLVIQPAIINNQPMVNSIIAFIQSAVLLANDETKIAFLLPLLDSISSHPSLAKYNENPQVFELFSSYPSTSFISPSLLIIANLTVSSLKSPTPQVLDKYAIVSDILIKWCITTPETTQSISSPINSPSDTKTGFWSHHLIARHLLTDLLYFVTKNDHTFTAYILNTVLPKLYSIVSDIQLSINNQENSKNNILTKQFTSEQIVRVIIHIFRAFSYSNLDNTHIDLKSLLKTSIADLSSIPNNNDIILPIYHSPNHYTPIYHILISGLASVHSDNFNKIASSGFLPLIPSHNTEITQQSKHDDLLLLPCLDFSAQRVSYALALLDLVSIENDNPKYEQLLLITHILLESPLPFISNNIISLFKCITPFFDSNDSKSHLLLITIINHFVQFINDKSKDNSTLKSEIFTIVYVQITNHLDQLIDILNSLFQSNPNVQLYIDILHTLYIIATKGTNAPIATLIKCRPKVIHFLTPLLTHKKRVIRLKSMSTKSVWDVLRN